jgi:type IV pilus assembly protein PilB
MATDPNLEKHLVMLDQETEEHEEEKTARELADRLELPFDPLHEFHVDPELFRTIPVEVMLRYQFLPLRERDGVLQVIMADPARAGHIPVVSSAGLTDPLMVESSAMLRSGVPLPLQFTDQEFLDELETAVVNVVQQGSNPIFALNFAQESLGLPITVIPTATPAGQGN